MADVSLLRFSRKKKVFLVRQAENSECGLACLAMIASYHGYKTSLSELRQAHGTSLKGTTTASLIESAQTMGLTSRPLRLEPAELKQLQMPCLLHWRMNHFVVLRSVSPRGLDIADPAGGDRHVGWAEVGTSFTGVAVEFSKGPDFRSKPASPRITLKQLTGNVQGIWRSLARLLALGLVLEVITLAWPQFLQIEVDQVIADHDRDLLGMLAATFAIVLIMQYAIQALRSWTLAWVSSTFKLSWTDNVFRHLLSLPQDYFLKRHLGDVVSRFGSVAAIQQTLTTQSISAVIDSLMAIITVGMMMLYSVPLAGACLGTVFVYAALRLLYFRIYRESNLSLITVSAKQSTHFMEAVRGLQTIRLHNRESAHAAQYANNTADTLNMSVAIQRLDLLFSTVGGIISGGQRIAIVSVGAWLALSGQFSAGMLMAFVAYADQFTGRTTSLVDTVIQFRLLRLQAERLADIVLTPPERHANGTYLGDVADYSISFEGVSFRYGDGEPWVLRECSFEVKSGEFVAIMGASGCGKSTVAKLIVGLLDPQFGSIKVGGVDIRTLGKNRLRQLISTVMQDDSLFSGSVSDNISFHDELASMERVERAARLAELHDDISAMPMGYSTSLGDMGSALSGGQRQRLHLARALYRDPKLLCLDEATSHVDVPCERRINEHLKQMDMTRIVIAHREDTIQAADRVLLCIHGQVVEVRAQGKQGGDAPMSIVG